MNEQAGFEVRAVLAPRRRRMARLAPLLPVVALVAVAWAGFGGPRSGATAQIPDRTADAAPSSTVAGSTPAPVPAQVLGLHVQQLDEVQAQSLGRDDVIAVAGWYVATAITDCPPLAALHRQGSLPEVRGDVDEAAFCDRSGALYASQPDAEDGSSLSAGLSAVGVTIVMGVIVPRELEMIGADATEVVVVGRFVDSGDGCRIPADCAPELVVDHVAWTPGA
jgi:hypothetical protein